MRNMLTSNNAIAIYHKNLESLYTSPCFNASTRVLFKLFDFAEDDNKIYMNSNRREELKRVCKISESSYCRAISELYKAGIITIEDEVYTINSELFQRGN